MKLSQSFVMGWNQTEGGEGVRDSSPAAQNRSLVTGAANTDAAAESILLSLLFVPGIGLDMDRII